MGVFLISFWQVVVIKCVRDQMTDCVVWHVT